MGLAEEPGQSQVEPGLGGRLDGLALPFLLLLNVSPERTLPIFLMPETITQQLGNEENRAGL